MLGNRPLRGLNGQMHMPSKIEKKQAAAKLRKPPRDFSYTQNRELSWLRFDNRVLDEAFDETVPLFERLKFVSIFEWAACPIWQSSKNSLSTTKAI